MSKRTIRGLGGALAMACAGCLPSGPLSAQADESTSAAEAKWFRNDDGILVERFRSGVGVGIIPFTEDTFFDEHGGAEKVVTRYADGRSVTEHRAFGPPLSDGGQRFLVAQGRNMSREQMERFLSWLPPLPDTSWRTDLGLYRGQPRPVDGASPDSGHPWGWNWVGERADGFARTAFRLLHQEMEVESMRVGEKGLSASFEDEEWLRITDSRGGLRHDRLSRTAYLERHCNSRYGMADPPRQRSPFSCDQIPSLAVASYDSVGRIAHVVRNDDGYPTETWYGETLVARYHYAHVDGVRPLPPHGGLGDFWLELVDARTGRRLVDSWALPTTSAMPLFSAVGVHPIGGGPSRPSQSGVIESVDDELFAVVRHHLFVGRYALLPLGEGSVWRVVSAAGTEAPELSSRVHYTDDRLRIEFGFDHTQLVVEAPRRGSSAIEVTWPQGINLPFGAGGVVAALVPPRQPLPPEDGRVPPARP